MSRRILVTGSRSWEPSSVELVLSNGIKPGDVVVHGDCPNGVDRLVRDWCTYRGVEQEPHPADWATHGRAAGPIRNQEMVDLGADVCLAWPHGESRGTRDCMDRAAAAGIEVINYGDRR